MKTVLFDFGGTLDADGTTWPDRFHPIYKESGVDFPRETFLRAFYASDDGLAARFPLKGLSFEDTVLLQTRCVLETLAPEKEALAPRIAGKFVAGCRAHFHRNRPMLERLASRYRLGIVSNFYGNLDGVLASEDLRGLFGSVADSGVLGARKPEPAIFLHALRELGGEPADSVMVGDSIPRDMRGAEGLRMAHSLISADKDAACCPDARRLASLTELESLLS